MTDARRYARDTSVTTGATRAEIEGTLRRYGADAFVYAEDRGEVTIMFRLSGRLIRFGLTMPNRTDKAFREYMRGRYVNYRTEAAALAKWEQACRQRWRALALVIKAKLEAVAAGIVTVEDEFLAQTMMSDGQTVGEVVRPQLEEHLRVVGPPHVMLEARKP